MILELNEPTRSVFVKTMTDNEWVVSDPAPTAHVVNVTTAGVDMVPGAGLKMQTGLPPERICG